VAGYAFFEGWWVEDRFSRLGRILVTLHAQLARAADEQIRVLGAVATVAIGALLSGGM
jgi:hypothetical protein